MRLSRGAAAALVLLSLAGCSVNGATGSPQGPGPKICDTRVTEVPGLIRTDTDVAITTATESQCDRTPTLHRVEVHLEREVKGQWTDRLDMLGGGGVRICNRRPHPGETVPCRQTLHGCISGVWRVRVLVDWAITDASGKPVSGRFEVPEHYAREIRCPGPRGAQ